MRRAGRACCEGEASSGKGSAMLDRARHTGRCLKSVATVSGIGDNRAEQTTCVVMVLVAARRGVAAARDGAPGVAGHD
jgi:hypothetical protein